MRNNFSSDEHDPGDEDPTERVKRALLEVLDQPFFDSLPCRCPLCVQPQPPLAFMAACANPVSLGEVWIGTTQPDAATLAEILGLGRG